MTQLSCGTGGTWNSSPRFQLNHAPIIECDCRRSGDYETDVFNGAPSYAYTRPDVLAPLPPRLIRCATDCHPAEIHQFKFPFFHHTHFIRFLEGFKNYCYLLAAHACDLKRISAEVFSRWCDHVDFFPCPR